MYSISVSLPVFVFVSVSYSEEVFELWAVVECRDAGGEQQHGLCSLPPLFNHSFIKPPCSRQRQLNNQDNNDKWDGDVRGNMGFVVWVFFEMCYFTPVYSIKLSLPGLEDSRLPQIHELAVIGSMLLSVLLTHQSIHIKNTFKHFKLSLITCYFVINITLLSFLRIIVEVSGTSSKRG